MRIVDYFGHVGVDDIILFKFISDKHCLKCGLGFFDSLWSPVTSCCEHGNGPSSSIKGKTFI